MHPAAICDAIRADRIAGTFKLTGLDEIVWRELWFRYRNKNCGECWPSYDTLASTSGVSRRTVATSIKRLRTAGWLRWTRRRKKLGSRWVSQTNLYEPIIPRRWRRSVSECKSSGSRTTSIFSMVAVAGLNRPAPARPPAKVQPPPPNLGHNMLASVEDDGLRAVLASFGAALLARDRK